LKSAWTKVERLYLKKTKQNKTITAGGMAQTVEHLPSKCEARSSNPATKKKKKNQSM
jgi:hypothetical protein